MSGPTKSERDGVNWTGRLNYVANLAEMQSLPVSAQTIREAAAEITRLRAENAEMREALEPFAEEADLWNAFDETVVLVEPFPDLPGSSGLMVHHLRRARAARMPAEGRAALEQEGG